MMRFLQRLFSVPPDTFELMRQGDVDSVIAALRHSLPWVRRDAVLSLGKTGDQQFRELLTAALNDNDAEVRRVAQEALAKLGDPEVIERDSIHAAPDSAYVVQPH